MDHLLKFTVLRVFEVLEGTTFSIVYLLDMEWCQFEVAILGKLSMIGKNISA